MLKTALIGYGYWGSKLARNFNNIEDFDLVSFIDTNKKNLSFAKKNYPLAKFSNNYKKTIKNDDVDFVIISSPTITHYQIAKFALENFKHVLVEKPLSLKLDEVKKLNKIAKKNNKMLFVDYPFLFSGAINFIKKVIDKKKYGKIIEIESFREQAPIRTDVNVIWDLCTHDISILNYLLKTKPSSIKTIKKKNIKGPHCDTAYISLKYPNRINALIKNAWISPTKIRLIKIKFEKAIIYCDENESLYKIKVYKLKSPKLANYNLEIPDIDLGEPLSKLATYIYKSIQNKNNKLFKNKFNEEVTHILERINKSND